MSDITWKDIRADAAAMADVRSEIMRRTGWNAETLDGEVARLQGACNLVDEGEASRAMLEIALMRERFTISEALNPPAQLRLVEAMWLRHWTGDEIRAALADVVRRFRLQPATVQEAIEALLQIGYRYRSMKQPDRWTKPDARARGAELMWLTGQSENEVFQAAREAIERFELGRGNDEQALEALQEITILRRATAFDPVLPEAQQEALAETMWLRGWTLQQALEHAVALRARLGLTGVAQPIEILHAICLRCGGPSVPNAVTEAVDTILADASASEELRETVRTEFGELRWLRGQTVAQALERIRRLESMTGEARRDVFHAALESARESYRARHPEQESQKP